MGRKGFARWEEGSLPDGKKRSPKRGNGRLKMQLKRQPKRRRKSPEKGPFCLIIPRKCAAIFFPELNQHLKNILVYGPQH